MRLHVKVVEGLDLLRSPLDRCGPYGEATGNGGGDGAEAGPSTPGGSPGRDAGAAQSTSPLSPNSPGTTRGSNFAKRSVSSSNVVSNSGNANGKSGAMSSMRRFAMTRMRGPLLGRSGHHRRPSATVVQTGKPFVRLKLKEEEQTTTIGEDAGRWKWNEEFIFDVSGLWEDGEAPSDENQPVLDIEVRDSVKCQCYGFIRIPLERLSGSGLVEQWYQLQRPPRSAADDEADAVLIASAMANQYLMESDLAGAASAPTSPNVDEPATNSSSSDGGRAPQSSDAASVSASTSTSATDRDLESCGVLFLSLHFENEVDELATQKAHGKHHAENLDDAASVGSAAISGSSVSSRASSPRRHSSTRASRPDSSGQIASALSPTQQRGSRSRHIPVRLADYVVLARFPKQAREPELAERYPSHDHHDLGLPVKLEWFIFAFGKKAEAFISSSEHTVMGASVDIFAFVHAPRGVAMFGYCLMYHEKDSGTAACVCILSRLNTGDMFRDVLLELHEACLRAAQDSTELEQKTRERLAHRLVHDIPMPLPGELRIEFNLDVASSQIFHCELPPLGTPPRLTFSEGLEFLVQKLGIQLLVSLWGAMLLETKLIMHSRKQRELSITGETLLALLYPFRWHHTYISVLPPQLTECLEAPFPFVLGLHSDLVENRDKILDHELDHALILDLDRGIVRKGAALHIEPLPRAEARRLERMLAHAVNLNPCALDDPADPLGDWEEECKPLVRLAPKTTQQAQLCFLECICQMLQGYRECLFFLNESMPVFNTPKFLERRAAEAPFFSHLLETQAFENFKEIQHSKWLETFHAYFFRVRIRNRNKEQYLSLANQKRVMQERRRAAAADPDNRDFDGRIRSHTIPPNEVALKRRDARNENAIASGLRRRAPGNHAPGLDPLPLELAEDDDPAEAGGGGGALSQQHGGSARRLWSPPPISQVIHCIMSEDDPQGKASSLEVGVVASEVGADADALADALRDLKIVTGTQNFHEHGFDALQQFSDVGGDSMDSDGEPTLGSDASMRQRSRSRSRSDSAARKGLSAYEPNYARERSKRDRRIELALQECITRIFLNKAVDKDQLDKCGTAFMTSKHARDLFVLILYQPQHRSVSNYNYAYGSRGRGLREDAFFALVKLCCELLEACYRREDYQNARQMLDVSQSYYLDRSAPVLPLGANELNRSPLSPNETILSPVTGMPRRGSIDAFGNPTAPVPPEDYLDSHLRGLELWKSLLFWEDAFAETLALEMRKRQRSLTMGASTALHEIAPSGSLRADALTGNSSPVMDLPGSARNRTERHASLGGPSLQTPASAAKPVTSDSSFGRVRRMTAPAAESSSPQSSFSSRHVRGGSSSLQDVIDTGVSQDTLFELTSTMVHQMIRIGAPEDKAKALVSRVVSQHGLNEEHEDTLYTLISNVSRAVEVSQSISFHDI
ncbi:DENN domain-containing protein 5A [Hondaea fermentalgiana]|uniref:DENN domain-containing protein 5A n=1 Tax=Hondaea fermentalgiana TaxID=2315210 RepID=A0A2R5GQD9_9STRA|nr:DENN domain-containing protein 5A [Hondaea fermentalgiana]|eukprot:GBG33077.1 DENN domain-containing protein 5A [Hondaea fermentalgiana]